MQNIVFIAPDPTIADTAQRMALELGLQNKVRLHICNLSSCLDVAREAEKNGADVIVARGWSADRILGSDVRTPVVHIPVGIQDLAEVLVQARRLTGLENPHVGFVTFPRVHWDLAAFARLLGMHLRVYSSLSEAASIADAVRQAVRNGAHVVVGGGTSARMAQELNTPATMLVSGEDSVRQALLQAHKVVYARKLEHTQAEKLRAVLDNSRDGIVSLDSGGKIVLLNPAARRMLRLNAPAAGKPLEEVLNVPGLADCLAHARPLQDEVVSLGKRELLVNAVPLTWQHEMTGVMLSLQDTRSISALETKLRRTARGLEAHFTFDDIRGNSSQIMETVRAAQRYAQGQQSVLIMGETGTGKELFAQAIHNASPYAQGPFVAVNCGALPPSLLESELFGYEAGAFTGASHKGKVGLFELAHRGTLFLDEISEMDLHGQTRLLRAVEDRSVMPLGGSRRLTVDLRIIAATNVNLMERVRQGSFRQDLFYRLKVLTLSLPPLRQREGDIPLLARHFLSMAGGEALYLEPSALEALEKHDWPGNVRELRYLLDSLIFDSQGQSVDAALVRRNLGCTEHLGPEPPPPHAPCPLHPDHKNGPPAPLSALGQGQEDAQRKALIEALEQCQGHQGKAALLLGLDRSTLYRHMKRLGIKKRLG